jgi:hypothetical protein
MHGRTGPPLLIPEEPVPTGGRCATDVAYRECVQRRWLLGLTATSLGLMSLVLALLVAAPGGPMGRLSDHRPTEKSLSDEPAAELQYPGSTKLLASGNEARWSMEDGPVPAMTWRQYGLDGEWDQVVAYFGIALTERGWRDGGCSSGLPSMLEWDVRAWHTDDRILRMSHNRTSSAPGAGSFHAIYEVTLIGEGLSPGCADR